VLPIAALWLQLGEKKCYLLRKMKHLQPLAREIQITSQESKTYLDDGEDQKWGAAKQFAHS
jgi:hypothetical protein